MNLFERHKLCSLPLLMHRRSALHLTLLAFWLAGACHSPAADRVLVGTDYFHAGGAGPQMVTDRADAAFQMYLCLSPYTLSQGLLELERENLVEIHRADSPAGSAPADRLANVYCLNAPAAPAAWAHWETAQRTRYGHPVWDQARRLAADLNEPRDPAVLETLADLITRHGYPTVRRAHAATVRLKPGSARRHLRTTVAALAAGQAE